MTQENSHFEPQTVAPLGEINITTGVPDRVGARVRRDDSEIAIDVKIDLKYGYSVPEVAMKVQQKVKEQIFFMTDLVVQEVNVHVASIQTEASQAVDYLHLDETDGE